jgi:hypothetical protein
MPQHRGALDVETSNELGYGVPFNVGGDQPLDISASQPVVGLAVARSAPPSGFRVDVSLAVESADILVTDLNEVDRGV